MELALMITKKDEIQNLSQIVDLSFVKNKRILITGGSGMLGSYLLESICRICENQSVNPKEIKVLSFTNNFNSISHLLKYKFVNFESFDSTNFKNFNGFNFVIHASSPASPRFFLDRPSMEKVNVKPLSFLVSSETEKLLLFSSGEVYGDSPPLNVREDYSPKISETQFRASYPISKKLAEEHGQLLSNHLGFKFIAARIFHTFGPGVRQNDGRSFADFLWSAAHGEKPFLKSTGTDVRSFLYSKDCILALLISLAHKDTIGPINIGGEESMSILSFARRISLLTGLGGEISQEGSHSHNEKIIVPNLNKIKSLGWSQTVDLDQAIIRTIDWIKSKSNLRR